MREYAAPPAFDVPAARRLTDPVVAHAQSRPDAPLLSHRVGGSWVDLSAGRFHDRVVAVAKGLVAHGVAPGDRVAVMARTRPEWTVLDYAVWWVGAVSVPVYATSSDAQLAWVLADSGTTLAVVEGAIEASAVERVRDQLPGLRAVCTIDRTDLPGVPDLDAVVASGSGVPDAAVDEVRRSVSGSDLATLIYTSGTTGDPKGCMLSHDNFLFEAEATAVELATLFDAEGASTLLVLPLAHVFARIVQVGAVNRLVRLGHAADPRMLLDDLGSFRPTFLLGVPRVFENAFTQLSQAATAAGRGRAFDRAIDVAIEHSRAERPGRLLRTRHAHYDRTVYASIREAFGGRCTHAIAGGAPLGDRLSHFFRGAGVTLLEGYGLTETTGATTVNTPEQHRVGTVGRPLPGTAARISDEGELLVRGPHVMQGYWRDGTPDDPRRDGWLPTGDLAEIDAEGFVRVTGRAEEIIVTAGGKSVAPARLEELVRAHPLVSQCLVVGDGRPFVAALITLDPEAYAEWAEDAGKGPLPRHADDPDLRAEVQKAVDRANRAVSQAEAIRKFVVLPHDWTEEGGALTASRKLRRTVVVRESRRTIRDIYDN